MTENSNNLNINSLPSNLNLRLGWVCPRCSAVMSPDLYNCNKCNTGFYWYASTEIPREDQPPREVPEADIFWYYGSGPQFSSIALTEASSQ